jgi:hypothetical protein
LLASKVRLPAKMPHAMRASLLASAIAMAGHRHLSRGAAPLLPRDTSPFDAIHLIIGMLREYYAPPQDLPREMRQLLTKFDEGEARRASS